MPFRSIVAIFSLAFVLGSSAAARDRDRDRDDVERESPPAVVDARTAADAAYEAGDYPRVIALTNWLIENFPRDHAYVAYHLRASAKIEMGRVSGSAKQVREGIADARQALALAGTVYPWLHIPYLYGLTSLAEIEHRPEHADQAIKVVSPVLQFPATKEFTEDDRANLYYQRGLAYAARRDFKLAAADQAEAIRLDSDHLGAHVKRAEALAALGQTKLALAAYDASVAQFPTMLLVYNDRGSFRRTTGDLDGAISDFSRCLAIDPKFAVGYINRGLCLAEENDPQAAESDFSQALKQKLDAGLVVRAQRLRGAARLAQGKAPAAIADFDAAIEASPQEAVLYEERGFANFFQKSFPLAVADFSKALELKPQSTYLIPWQALAKARAGQTAQARSLLETSLRGKTPATGWTAQICSFLLEQSSQQQLLDAADEASGSEKNQRLCEAHYFIGQQRLLRDEGPEAAEHFREAADRKEYSLSAFRGARYELADFK